MIPKLHLNNLDYTKFAEYTEISDIKAQDFFQYLSRSGYIYLKVITRCPNCNCDCTVDTKLYGALFECNDCGEEFNWRDRIGFANFSYKVNPDIVIEDKKKRISSPLEIFVNSEIQHETKVIEMVDKIKDTKQASEEDIRVDRKEKVFIVHGSDEATARRVKQFIKDDLNMEAVILMDEVNCGLTIPEKFEQRANECSYAVIIMTPDDVLKYEGDNKIIYRARQNVILELGYFWAKWDRKQLAVIKKGNIENPSDIQGVVYLEFNKRVEEVLYDLTREIKASLGI
ncbi:nucleotide-binding protein [Clostridium sp.]|uniref:nucleotide-binding protein n=1 Tax=Clostridium sp. TaxID=1506 RepID=UPI001A4B75AA|nr:nucleotide-binding protein [Clostridium sp.]MBK5241697.1 nucleotide-binding protein [Clostridium sp.]